MIWSSTKIFLQPFYSLASTECSNYLLQFEFDPLSNIKLSRAFILLVQKTQGVFFILLPLYDTLYDSPQNEDALIVALWTANRFLIYWSYPGEVGPMKLTLTVDEQKLKVHNQHHKDHHQNHHYSHQNPLENHHYCCHQHHGNQHHCRQQPTYPC